MEQNSTKPSETVETVIGQLNDKLAEFMDEDQYDPRAVFTFTYRHITETIQAGLPDQAELTLFEDPRWVADLDKRFADYYFEAIDDFDSGISPRSKVWAAAFEAIDAGDRIPIPSGPFTILKAKVIPMIAHITHDLPVALSDLKADNCHRKDYNTLNSLLTAEIENIQDEKSLLFGEGLQDLDEFGGKLDEWLTGKMIPQLRDQAWHDAQDLHKDAIEDNTLKLINKFNRMDVYGNFGNFLFYIKGLLDVPNVSAFWSRVFDWD